ncbi:ATP-dependent DNA/RNA helicase [Tulasnella sp. 424]|nr:ATP-dependent DNA/RNA helicase [Tulasnella sp. 424]KAG8970651.1 ATP-dependent DNA/RNA helicase [Tulasnella sp. 425]
MPDANLIDDERSFESFSDILDVRILKALSDLGFARPTLIQSKAIPLALEGRDILARARTGSGKTAAYCIPVVQQILTSKTSSSSSQATQGVRALILVPTRELSEQVTSHIKAVANYCGKQVIVTNIASGNSSQLQQIVLSDQPNVVVATPARILPLLQSKALTLQALETLVIDEADLILSYGHDEDVQKLFTGGYLPKLHQSLLMSATMTEDVVTLKGLALRSPLSREHLQAILKLEEDKDEAANLTQFFARCTEEDKFLLTYVILKLKLIKGKCLMFVNDVERSYRLKLFLEQFSIRSCVLNPELPLNSRYHVVQEFNRGAYDYIIATDEAGNSATPGSAPNADTEEEGAGESDRAFVVLRFKALSNGIAGIVTEPKVVEVTTGLTEADEELPTPSAKAIGKRKRGESPLRKGKKGKRKPAEEFGVSRGIDFVDVACVINFDFPLTSDSYTHRVGRTARAGRTGMALSFLVATPEQKSGTEKDWRRIEKVFKKVDEEQAARGSKLKEYKFDMKQVEAFRYRMNDALRAVTKNAIKEARLAEIKTEILKSEKLKAHFEDNPLDLDYLRHDQPLNPARIQPHMKDVPQYLLPRAAQSTTSETDLGFVPFSKGRGRGRGGGRAGRRSGSRDQRSKKKRDPLKHF